MAARHCGGQKIKFHCLHGILKCSSCVPCCLLLCNLVANKSDTFLYMGRLVSLRQWFQTANTDNILLVTTMLVKLLSATMPDDSVLQCCHYCQTGHSRFCRSQRSSGVRVKGPPQLRGASGRPRWQQRTAAARGPRARPAGRGPPALAGAPSAAWGGWTPPQPPPPPARTPAPGPHSTNSCANNWVPATLNSGVATVHASIFMYFARRMPEH